MLPIPSDIAAAFEAVLAKRGVFPSRHADYRKWLRYFLDFLSKYPPPASKSEQVRLFIDKLRSKGQSPENQKQAAHALSLFFESQQKKRSPSSTSSSGAGPAAVHRHAAESIQRHDQSPAAGLLRSSPPDGIISREASAVSSNRGSRFNEWRCLEKSGSPAWDVIIEKLAAEIKTRHYSRKTLKTYADWCRKFQSYLKDKTPCELSPADVKAYLTYLAVNCNVAASTQNQAFNALLFLYRHILKKDFGEHKDIPRAKRSNYIPVVLSRQEIDAVLKHLRHPYDLSNYFTAADFASLRELS